MTGVATDTVNVDALSATVARSRRGGARRALRRTAMAVLAMLIAACLWEGYKLVGPEQGGKVFGWSLLPRSGDQYMPHVWDMIRRLTRPVVANSDQGTVFGAVVTAAWYSFRIALVGLLLGTVFGLGLATLMARFGLLRKAFLPYLIASQTVPLIALAPIVVSWGGKLTIFGFEFERWMTTSMLGAFLAFFPISVGALRGFATPNAASLELMDSYAASWWQSFRKLRFPASVQYLAPAFRLAAAAAVVGVVVSEISIGVAFGIGRLILAYAGESDPAKVYAAVFGAAALGLAMAAVAAAVDRLLMMHRPTEIQT